MDLKLYNILEINCNNLLHFCKLSGFLQKYPNFWGQSWKAPEPTRPGTDLGRGSGKTQQLCFYFASFRASARGATSAARRSSSARALFKQKSCDLQGTLSAQQLLWLVRQEAFGAMVGYRFAVQENMIRIISVVFLSASIALLSFQIVVVVVNVRRFSQNLSICSNRRWRGQSSIEKPLLCSSIID